MNLLNQTSINLRRKEGVETHKENKMKKSNKTKVATCESLLILI